MTYNYFWKIFNKEGLLKEAIMFQVPESLSVEDFEDELEYYIRVADNNTRWVLDSLKDKLGVTTTHNLTTVWTAW